MSAQPPARDSRPVTATSFAAFKEARRPIVMLTAYDHPTARLVDSAGVDAILVGDSLGMTVLGMRSTLGVTIDDMVRHTSAVASATRHAMVIADMPFMSYQADPAEGIRNGGRLVAEGGAAAVKIEGAAPSTLEVIRRLVEAGVPVMGHLGLTPQSVNVLGGYRSQAKDAPAAAKLMSDALACQAAGAFAIVLECIPAELAARVTELLSIPTIGIGAGPDCDGEVQVFHDVLGLGEHLPRHAKRYADLSAAIVSAVEDYAAEVRDKAFPAEENSVHVEPESLAEAELLFASSESGAQ